MTAERVPLPDSVIGPEAWLSLVDQHSKFVDDWGAFLPEGYETYPSSKQFAQAMRAHRADLVRYAEAIRDELLSEGEAEHATVFSRQLSELAEEMDPVMAVIRDELMTRFKEAAERDQRPAIDDCVRELLTETQEDDLCRELLTSEYAKFKEDFSR